MWVGSKVISPRVKVGAWKVECRIPKEFLDCNPVGQTIEYCKNWKHEGVKFWKVEGIFTAICQLIINPFGFDPKSPLAELLLGSKDTLNSFDRYVSF